MKTSPLSHCALAIVLALAGRQTASAYTWSSSGFGGGGTQNSVVMDPTNANILIVGSDVSGIQRSTDGGKTWVGSNTGLTDRSVPQEVASVAWDNDTSTAGQKTVYAAATSGFFISTDAGISWNESTGPNEPTFDGNQNNGLSWPRDTGNLIFSDQTGQNKYLYAGSAKNGVYRSTDGGNSWAQIGLSQYEITGLVGDPNNPWILYVTTRGNGVWWTNTARSPSPAWNPVSGAPAYPEDAQVDGSILYVVGANTNAGMYTQQGGLWKATLSPTPGAMSQPYASGAVPADTSWTAVTASGSTVFIGAAFHDGKNSIMRSTDAGVHWTSLTSGTTNVNGTIFDGSGQPWWIGAAGGDTAYLLGSNAAGISQLIITSSDNNNLVAACRASMWGTHNATASAGSVAWYPYAGGYSKSTPGGGIGVTGVSAAAVDPFNAGYLYIGVTDWTFAFSTDYGATFQRSQANTNHGTKSDGIYVDPTTGVVYMSVFNYHSDDGNVYSSTPGNITSIGNWTDEGLATAAPGFKVYGVVSNKYTLNGTTHTVVLAILGTNTNGVHGGLWRKDNGQWSKVPGNIYSDDGYVHQDFCWAPNSPNVYVFVENSSTQYSGLWRSTDYGQTWGSNPIWTNISHSNPNYCGYLVSLPSNPDNTLFMSTEIGIYKVTNASTNFNTAPLTAPFPGNLPGALTFGTFGGYTLFCNDVGPGGDTPALYQCTAPATNPQWSKVSDTSVYPGQGAWAAVVRQDPNHGQLYVGTNHEGVIMAAP